MTMQQRQPAPAGWYPEPGNGNLRWWDGQAWGPYAPQQQAAQPHPQPYVPAVVPLEQVVHPTRYANKMPVSYVRPQQGHSLTGWLIASLFGVGIPFLLYYSFSPNHYWRT